MVIVKVQTAGAGAGVGLVELPQPAPTRAAATKSSRASARRRGITGKPNFLRDEQRRIGSGEQLRDELAAHVGQPEVPPLESIRQLLVVDSQ